MMKMRITKLTAILLTLIMMLGLVPSISVSAAYENTHVNTGNQAHDIVEVAKTQIGYTEGSNNDTKYNRWFGTLSGLGYNYSWCQTFVAWCANQANISTSDIARVSGTISAKDAYKKNGTYHYGPYEGGSYTPKKGDIIFFYSSATDSKHHVGIVSDCINGTVYTIEGNTSNKVLERSYPVTHGDIRGYGVPEYSGTVIKPPTLSFLKADKNMVATGEEITFTATSDYAIGFTIGIDNTTERYITQEMPNGQLTLTFDTPGTYGAYVTAYNSIGYADSNWINFTVYNTAPSFNILNADKNMIAIGEEITFTAASDYAIGFTIGIDNATERYITQGMPDGQLTLTFDTPGTYGAYVTAYNSIGYADSNWIGFTVYDTAPSESYISIDKYFYTVGEDIVFNVSSDTATMYSIGLYKDGERYESFWDFTTNNYTYQLTEAGNYYVYVTSSNLLGWKDSIGVNFTVHTHNKSDINQDNLTSISDAIVLQKHLLNLKNLTDEQKTLADINDDGKVNIFDLALLKAALK